jgi:hypothetical protein
MILRRFRHFFEQGLRHAAHNVQVIADEASPCRLQSVRKRRQGGDNLSSADIEQYAIFPENFDGNHA